MGHTTHSARIVGPVHYLGEGGRDATIPLGPCLVEQLDVRHSADLPLLLIFIGVIGGLIAFGPLGIFVGPVVMAVAYTLLTTWVGADPASPAHPSTPRCTKTR